MQATSTELGDTEEVAYSENAASTAPTTPEGSLTFSPILRAAADGALDIEYASLAARANNMTLSSSQLPTRAPAVRNICCVGAGYVGK